jgi:hypothetical protein
MLRNIFSFQLSMLDLPLSLLRREFQLSQLLSLAFFWPRGLSRPGQAEPASRHVREVLHIYVFSSSSLFIEASLSLQAIFTYGW